VELLHAIQREGSAKAVIGMSACVSWRTDTSATQTVHFDRFLKKPFDALTLLNEVRSVLSSK
jgi:DNA-binding NtrC family response regulator